MKISENDLLIHYDDQNQKIVVYRLYAEGFNSTDKILHTEYSISTIKSMEIDEASRLLGEDVLIAIAGTRKELF